MERTATPLAVNVTEAARLLGMGKSYLYREIKEGRINIPLLRMGKKTLVRVKDLEDWLAAQEVAPI